jgi:membrane fusion protein, copper/silver efflux system
VIESYPVMVHYAGVLTWITAPEGHKVRIGEVVATLRVANALTVHCELPTQQFDELPSRVAVHVSGSPGHQDADTFICDLDAVPLLDPKRIEGSNRTSAALPLPAHVALEQDQTVHLRISDPMTARTTLAVPSDCLAFVRGRQHVLVHTGPGELILVPVTAGATTDGFTEVSTGLGEGEPVVRSFNALADHHPEFSQLITPFQMPASNISSPLSAIRSACQQGVSLRKTSSRSR